MDKEKAENAAKSEAAQKGGEEGEQEQPLPGDVAAMAESQYKNPSGRHTRAQSMFRASINKSRSMGGIVDAQGTRKLSESIDERFNEIDEMIIEDLVVDSEGAQLLAERGQFTVNGQTAINNHADILKIMTQWLMDNRPDAIEAAVGGMKDMIESGMLIHK